MFTSRNQGVRPNKLPHLQCWSWGLKTCVDSDSWLSQSRLAKYFPTLIHLLSFKFQQFLNYKKGVTEMRPLAQAVSGKPPVAVSMAVGQFFNPEEGAVEVSSQSMLLSTYWAKVIILKRGHTLPLHLQCFETKLVKSLVNWFFSFGLLFCRKYFWRRTIL